MGHVRGSEKSFVWLFLGEGHLMEGVSRESAGIPTGPLKEGCACLPASAAGWADEICTDLAAVGVKL